MRFVQAIFIKFDVLSSLFWFVMLLNGYRLEFQFRRNINVNIRTCLTRNINVNIRSYIFLITYLCPCQL